jgi:DNA helicase-2/ATP-dependent DNA helicase PcrA
MPLDLMEDLSTGKSWLSFARGSSAINYESGEYRDQSGYQKEKKKYAGKTYDSVDSIAEFFKQRATQLGNTRGSTPLPATRPSPSARSSTSARQSSSNPASASGTSGGGQPSSVAGQSSSDFAPGSYVKHAKYGRGLVLRREGAGDSLKLTVTFPGFGQKKLVQKYAGLEKA